MSLTRKEHAQCLINLAENYISQEQFIEVVTDVLIAHNNYRSGWIDEIDDLFYNPADDQEKELAEKLTQIIIETVRGLLATAVATKEVFGYGQLEYIATFLHRLNQAAPKDLVAKTKKLIEESQQMGAPEMGLILIPSLTLLSELES